MPIVIDPNKQVTDPTLLTALTKQGIDWRYVELYQDYAPAYDLQGIRIKGRSPYAKFYRHIETNKQWMVVSQLPMVNADGIKVEVGWEKSGAKYASKVNQFQAQVSSKTTTITCINDQPTGQKKGNSLTYTPHLYLNGVEVFCGKETLLAVDPVNANYQNNVLEWDYGICKRRLRIIEGKILGTWVFATNPNGEVRIQYDQVGDFKLHLGQYAISDTEELIPAKAFENPWSFGVPSYPVTVCDSLTFYPDAHTESTSVDGTCQRDASPNEVWATIRVGAGTSHYDDLAKIYSPQMVSGPASTYWGTLARPIALYNTASLPDNAIISAAVESHYSTAECADPSGNTPNIAIYASSPASNTDLVNADFNTLGTTAFSQVMTYADYTTGAGYKDFTYNASGIAAISKTSVTKVGRRFATYDAVGTTPTWEASKTTYVCSYGAEQGNGYKPKLVVTYTVDQPFRNVYPHILAH